MDFIHHSRWQKIFAVCLFLLLPQLWTAQSAHAQAPVLEQNKQCLTCHSNPDLVIEFPDGSQNSGHVSSTAYHQSVHGQEEMTCGGCHPNHAEYPHPEVTANSNREYAIQLNETCFDCHPDQAERVADSSHAQARAAGHLEAALCVDCHGAHDTLSLHEARTEIAATCRQCHATIYDEYLESAHGSALIQEHNTDVPTCVDCHGVHNIEEPHTTEFRLQSPELCGSCHADEALMEKYGISTDVFETYVADFHGATVTLFEKQTPDAATNKPVCYDCHGVHAILPLDHPNAIASKKQNLLETCQKCHPDATMNFPDSWASHFRPTFEHQPLVAAVNLFYLIIIPGTLGFMGLFVFTDAGRRLIGRRDHDTPPPDGPLESSTSTRPTSSSAEDAS